MAGGTKKGPRFGKSLSFFLEKNHHYCIARCMYTHIYYIYIYIHIYIYTLRPFEACMDAVVHTRLVSSNLHIKMTCKLSFSHAFTYL